MKTGRFRWWMVWLLIGPITFVMSLDRTAIVVAAPVIQKEYGFSLVESAPGFHRRLHGSLAAFRKAGHDGDRDLR
jgi:hypothetical protein